MSSLFKKVLLVKISSANFKIGLIWVFFITAIAFPQNLTHISNLIADDKLIEATQKSLEKSLLSPNDVSIKKILAEIYLKRGLYEKAQREINYLLALTKRVDHLYLQAKLHQLKGEWEECEKVCYQMLARNRQYIPALLLLAQTHEHNKHYDLADINYKDISLINPKDRDFLIQYSLYLIKQNRLKEANSPIKLLRRLFPEHHRSLYVFSFYRFKRNQNKLALHYINKALFYKPANQDYQQLLFDIYLREKNYQAVINWLKTKKDKGDEWVFFNLAYYQFSSLKPEGFKIALAHYPTILTNLKKSLKKNSQNEYVRFFTENFVIDNTHFNHPDRLSLANYHQNRADFLSEIGDYDLANYHYLRAVSIIPEDHLAREAYTRFLKQTKKWHDYSRQLKVVKTLTPLDSFELDTKIEIIDRKLASSLTKRRRVDISSLPLSRKKIAIFPEIKTKDKKALYFKENVLRIINDFLKYSKNFEMVPFNEKHRDKENEILDYYLTIDFKYSPHVLIDFNFHDASTKLVLTNESFVRKGQYALVNILRELKTFLENIIPLRGKIIEKLNRNLIVDLGKENNLSEGQILKVISQFNVDRYYLVKIKEMDDHISEIELLDESDLPFIRLGDAVFLSNF